MGYFWLLITYEQWLVVERCRPMIQQKFRDCVCINKKAQLTQKITCNSDACVKARCERTLSSQRLAPYPVHEFQHWLKIANFSYPLSFSALVRGDHFQIYGKALRLLKLESSRQPSVKIWWSLHRFWLIYPCDGQTDGRTDGQTELRWQRRAIQQ